jgi:hypothetical protein
MFYLTVKATGGKLKNEKATRRASGQKPPEASFDQLASFIGAM